MDPDDYEDDLKWWETGTKPAAILSTGIFIFLACTLIALGIVILKLAIWL